MRSLIRNRTSSVALVSALLLATGGEASSAEPGAPPEIPFASPHARAVENPSAPDAWGGMRTGREPTLSDRVTHYEIDAQLDPVRHTVDGKERLTWRNRSDRPVRAIYLHLYLNAFEGPGSTFMTEHRERGFNFRTAAILKDGQFGHIELRSVRQGGVAVPWSFVHPDGGPTTDHTVVRLDLPTAVAPQASTTIDLDFHDQLPRVIARTGYWGSFHMVAQWFPKVGVLELPGERGATAPRWNVHEFHLQSEFYADWGAYDVRITVPKGYQVAAAGVETGAPVERAGQVTRRFVQGDIHDFAWMAARDFAPPLRTTVKVPGGQKVTVQVFYPPEYRASAQPALNATVDSIKWFSETLGPYPYQTSTCIIPPYNATEAGGMEYQTLFTALGFRSVVPGTFQATMLDFAVIHEFGHGYFYGLLASNEFEEPLLDEGLNEFWDMRMMRARGMRGNFTTQWLRRLGVDPSSTGFEYERWGGALDPHPADPVGENSWDRLSSRSYTQVYSRTAIVMRDLEARIGSDALERGFRTYFEQWRFRHPSTADLREALAEGSGQRAAVEQVFRQNIYDARVVSDRIQTLSSVEELPEPGTRFEHGKGIVKTQAEVDREIAAQRATWKKAHPDAKTGGPFPFRTTVVVRRDGAPVPQELRVTFADGSTETVRWHDERRWHRFVFHKPVKGRAAEIDPEHRHYLDRDKLDDGRTLEANGAAARRWSGLVAQVCELFFSLWGAL